MMLDEAVIQIRSAIDRTSVLWLTNFSPAVNHLQNQLVAVLYAVIMPNLGVLTAVLSHHATQCGFCTAGMLMTAKASLLESPNPSGEEITAYRNGNMRRCGAYPAILAAIQGVARAKARSNSAPNYSPCYEHL